jgi:hypothetical protein
MNPKLWPQFATAIGHQPRPKVYVDRYHRLNYGVWIGHLEGKPTYACASKTTAETVATEIASKIYGTVITVPNSRHLLSVSTQV